MREERGPETSYRGVALWAFMFGVCAALVYGAVIWLIFWLME
jgi:hypothetical protein